MKRALGIAAGIVVAGLGGLLWFIVKMFGEIREVECW